MTHPFNLLMVKPRVTVKQPLLDIVDPTNAVWLFFLENPSVRPRANRYYSSTVITLCY